MRNSYPAQHYEVQQLFQDESDASFEYELLKGHHRTDGSFKSSDELKTEYVRLTDGIIQQITEGITITDPKTGEKTKTPVDFVVWLDKSARPVSWLTRELWPLMAKNENGDVAPEPQHKFVNIDRNQWTSTIDPEGIGNTDVNGLDETIIRSLRSVFLASPKDRELGITEEIDRAPTLFDDKTILIVDEVRSSGRTLQYAHSLFNRAFPKANVGATYWMGDIVMKNGAVGNADLPVWYSDKTDLGRGVGNRNIDRSRLSRSSAQRMGAWFLSTALTEADPKGLRLREEMHQLAMDVEANRILVEPSRDRDDYEQRALEFNNVDDFDQFISKRKAQIEQK